MFPLDTELERTLRNLRKVRSAETTIMADERMGVDPTRSTGRRDSLLNEKKMWVDFRVLENPSPRRNGSPVELPLTFYFYFMKGKTK